MWAKWCNLNATLKAQIVVRYLSLQRELEQLWLKFVYRIWWNWNIVAYKLIYIQISMGTFSPANIVNNSIYITKPMQLEN